VERDEYVEDKKKGLVGEMPKFLPPPLPPKKEKKVGSKPSFIFLNLRAQEISQFSV